MLRGKTTLDDTTFGVFFSKRMFGVFVIRQNTNRNEEFPSLQELEGTAESCPPSWDIASRLEALSWHGSLQTALTTLTKLPNLAKLFQFSLSLKG